MDGGLLLLNQYPSGGDWNVLQSIGDNYGPRTGDYNPSLYLIDPFGVIREFKLSDRSAVEALDDAQMQAGVGLAERTISSSSCPGG